MGKNLWKLVRLSARGRRRENRALFLVLSFLFFLVAAGIVWFSISRYTRQEQKYDAFGEWKAAFYGGTEEQIRKFTENPATVRSGISRVGGSILSPDWEARVEELDRQFEWEMEETARACREAGIEFEMLPLDQYTLEEKIRTVLYLPPEEPVSLTDYFGEAGFIGTLDQGTAELGRIRMSQGRLPREDGEIALTEELLSSLGLEGKLGETVTLRVVGGENQMEERTYTLCGVLEPYGGGWVKKGYSLVSAVITEPELETFPWEKVCHVFTDIEGSVRDTIEIYGMPDESMEVIQHFAFNNLAYDFNGRTDYSYIQVVLAVVFLVSLLAVFQIMGSQIRKRSRQVSLLKAIGATDGQVAGLFLREIFRILWKAALLGTAAGILLVPGVLWLSGLAGSGNLYFHLDLPLLAAGLLLVCLMVYLGALFPIWKGKRIPLRGDFSPRVHRTAPLDPGKTYRKGRLIAAKSGGLFRAGTVLLLSGLAFSVFGGLYLAGEEMELGGESLQFEMGASADMHFAGQELDATLPEEVSGIPGIGKVYTEQYGFGGQGLYITYDGIGDSSLEPLRKQWNSYPYQAMEPYAKEEGKALSNVYGVYTGWQDNMEELAGMVYEGEPDWEAFEAGEEVLVYLPCYRIRDIQGMEEGESRIEFNTDPRYERFFLTDASLEPGAELTVQIAYRTAEENGEYRTAGTREFTVKVGGVVRYLPDTGSLRWDPEMMGAFCVIGSQNFVGELRSAWQQLEEESGGMTAAVQGNGGDALYDMIYLEGSGTADDTTWSSLQSMAESKGLYVAGNYEEWKEIHEEALDRTVWYMTGAVGIGFVMLCFLVQTLSSRLREDRRKLGILEALGVRKLEIRSVYGIRGLVNGGLALAAAHGAFFLTAFFWHREALAAMDPHRYSGGWEQFLHSLDLMFSGYPLGIHLLACLLVLVLSAAVYQIFLRSFLSEEPAEAIRELGE